MTALEPSGFLQIGGDRLEYRHLGPQPADVPTLVLLHEGLGSADLWADLPQRLQAGSGFGVVAFSRRGYGASSPRALPWPFAYMHEEALEMMPRVLDAIGFRSGVLVGASDGASIATIYAGGSDGGRDDGRVRGLTLIAPHFIVEDETAGGAYAAKVAYEAGDLRPKLARWHANVDVAFYGWNATWTNPDFKRDWNISGYLPNITVPIQILQGEKDEYATAKQIHIAQRKCVCPVEATLMPGVGHSIFRDAPAVTADAICGFVKRVAL